MVQVLCLPGVLLGLKGRSGMKEALYIFSDGQLKRKDDTLLFESENGKKYIPVEHVREIYVFGEINVTKKFLEFASRKEILLHFFNYHGYYTGTFYPREHHVSGHVTVRQAENYLDPEKRLDLARRFVEGGTNNMLQVMKYYASRGHDTGQVMASIEEEIRRISDVTTIEGMMGVEGTIRQIYYQGFDHIIQDGDFRFGRRTRRPPQNRLNVLISLGNSLLYSIALSEIYKTHLDPRIGFLHTANFRRFSLNLDVAEIFKPVIVDRVIFTVLGRKQIRSDDFDQEVEGLILKESARKIFVQEMERKLASTFYHRRLKRNVSYRHLIRLELYKIQKHVVGDEPYTPFVARW